MQTLNTNDHFEESRAASGQVRIGRWAFVGILFIAAFFGLRRMSGAGAMAAWSSDWDKALDQSAQSGKPMLVLFTADWCPPCQSLKKDVFADSEVASYLKREFSLVKVDLTERRGPNAETAQTYGVRGIPTLIVFNSKGQQVDRMSGAAPKDHMMQWFKQMHARAGR